MIQSSCKNSIRLVALYAEGVGRNLVLACYAQRDKPSPSTRRAWVEILLCCDEYARQMSPSTRRAWIEIQILRGCP